MCLSEVLATAPKPIPSQRRPADVRSAPITPSDPFGLRIGCAPLRRNASAEITGSSTAGVGTAPLVAACAVCP